MSECIWLVCDAIQRVDWSIDSGEAAHGFLKVSEYRLKAQKVIVRMIQLCVLTVRNGTVWCELPLPQALAPDIEEWVAAERQEANLTLSKT